MAFGEWLDDARTVAAVVPSDAPVAAELEYLLDDVVGRERSYTCQHAPASYQKGHHFRVYEHASRDLGVDVAAYVAKPDGHLVLNLPQHNPHAPKGNGALLLHELVHLTDPESNITPAAIPDNHERAGVSEGKAYALVGNILSAVDGSDFQRYVDALPYGVAITPQEDGTANYTPYGWSESWSVRPSAETLMRDIWDESGPGVHTLVVTGIAKKLERITADLPLPKARKLAGYILWGS